MRKPYKIDTGLLEKYVDSYLAIEKQTPMPKKLIDFLVVCGRWQESKQPPASLAPDPAFKILRMEKSRWMIRCGEQLK